MEALNTPVDNSLFAEFFDAFVEVALHDAERRCHEHYHKLFHTDSITHDALAEMRRDCEEFVAANRSDILIGGGNCGRVAGSAFFYSRNGYDTGFNRTLWTDLPTNPGERLKAAAIAFGECELHLGEDRKIHVDN